MFKKMKIQYFMKTDYWFKDPTKEIEIETFMGFGHEKKYQLKRY